MYQPLKPWWQHTNSPNWSSYMSYSTTWRIWWCIIPLSLDVNIKILLTGFHTFLTVVLDGKKWWCIYPFKRWFQYKNSPFWSSYTSYSTSWESLFHMQTTLKINDHWRDLYATELWVIRDQNLENDAMVVSFANAIWGVTLCCSRRSVVWRANN